MIGRMSTNPTTPNPARSGRGARLVGAALLLLGAAIIHLAGAPARLAESFVLGAGTAALGAVQVGLAVALVVVPARRLLFVAAGVSAGAALVWAAGHTVGLVLWRPEPLVIPDLFLPALEVAAALVLVAAAARAPRLGAPRAWLTALALVPTTLLAGILTAGGAIAAPDDTWLPVGAAITPAPGRTTTLTYCSPGGVPMAMDVTEPAAAAARPAPAVLYVHGGGWFEGDRQPSGLGSMLAGQDGALFLPLRDELSRRGFVVAAIDYRLAPLYGWPAQIEDAKCAVRFMRAEAARLGIDPDRIGAWGSSAGGHLVAMLGTAGPGAGFDVGQYLDRSSRLQAVVDMFGPTDLNAMGDSSSFGRTVVQLSFGGATAAHKAAASPVSHVAPGAPPFLVLHGTDDTLVRPHHSSDLADRLRAAGVLVTLVLVQHTGHSVATPGQQPGPEEVTAMVADFFSSTLAPAR
jgi:acetyl esterase/lipase